VLPVFKRIAPDKADEKKLSWNFPSVDEAYARTSWNADHLLVGVRKGEIVAHAGGHAVLIQPGLSQSPTHLVFRNLADDGRTARLRYDDNGGQSVTVELDRRKRQLLIRRKCSDEWPTGRESPNIKNERRNCTLEAEVSECRVTRF
jgi:hypothetical protein